MVTQAVIASEQGWMPCEKTGSDLFHVKGCHFLYTWKVLSDRHQFLALVHTAYHNYPQLIEFFFFPFVLRCKFDQSPFQLNFHKAPPYLIVKFRRVSLCYLLNFIKILFKEQEWRSSI